MEFPRKMKKSFKRCCNILRAVHFGPATFLCVCALFVWSPACGFGLSLDEMYRMSLRDENGGVLPGYIVNRGLTPWPEPKPPTPEERAADTGAGVIRLPLTQALPWPEVVKQVASGNPGPFAVDLVQRYTRSGNPEALELLAWMHVGGIGVQKDLPQAFHLYLRADTLGVSSAKDNAEAIYKAMTRAERRLIFNPFN